MVGWPVLRFLSLYATLLIVFVIGKLHVMKTFEHCPEGVYFNMWMKRPLNKILKIVR